VNSRFSTGEEASWFSCENGEYFQGKKLQNKNLNSDHNFLLVWQTLWNVFTTEMLKKIFCNNGISTVQDIQGIKIKNFAII